MKLAGAADVGRNIRYARKLRGLSLTELAWRSGYAKSSICEWEYGDKVPAGGTLDNLAEALGVPALDLYFGPPFKEFAP